MNERRSNNLTTPQLLDFIYEHTYLEDFLRKDCRTPCQVWTRAKKKTKGGRKKHAYPLIKYKGVQWRGNRLVWHLHYNVTLSPQDFINHKCANPKCLRLDHLYVGDAQENSDDMVAHGNSIRGEDHPKNVLSVEQVREGRDLWAHGTKISKIAKMFNVAYGTMWDAIHRKTFTWLD